MSRTSDGNEFAAAYTRFLAGETASLIGLLADDVVYHLPGGHLGGGTLRGRDAMLRRLADAGGWCEQIEVDVLAVAAAGVFVVTIERMRARREAHVLDQDVSVVWRFVESRCVEIRSTFADQAACDEFWHGFQPRSS